MNENVKRMILEAVNYCEAKNTDREWASLEINHTNTREPVVAVHYGTIHSNGMHEIAIATRRYFLDAHGFVHSMVHAHS